MTSSCTNEDPYHPISLTFPEVLSVISLDFTTVILSLSSVTIRFRYPINLLLTLGKSLHSSWLQRVYRTIILFFGCVMSILYYLGLVQWVIQKVRPSPIPVRRQTSSCGLLRGMKMTLCKMLLQRILSIRTNVTRQTLSSTPAIRGSKPGQR